METNENTTNQPINPTGKKSGVTAQYLDQWVELYQSGASTRTIAKQFNTSKTTITAALRKQGILRELKSYDHLAETWQTLYSNGVSVQEIANRYGTSRSTVFRYTSGIRQVQRKYEDRVDEIVSRYINGESVHDIAKATGISSQTILNYLRMEDVEIRESYLRNKEHTTNIDYFKPLTQPRQAFTLGLIFGVGSLVIEHDYIRSLTLITYKKHIVQFVLQELNHNPNIESFRYVDTSAAYNISSQPLNEQLLRMGLGAVKDIEPPILEDKLLDRHFLYGLFYAASKRPRPNRQGQRLTYRLTCRNPFLKARMVQFLINELDMREIAPTSLEHPTSIAIYRQKDIEKLVSLYDQLEQQYFSDKK